MDNINFVRTGENEYRAMVPGTLLILAQKQQVSLLVEDEPGKIINISSAQWLVLDIDHKGILGSIKAGIWGSIQVKTFSADYVYIVYYKPKSIPPHMFAVKLPA